MFDWYNWEKKLVAREAKMCKEKKGGGQRDYFVIYSISLNVVKTLLYIRVCSDFFRFIEKLFKKETNKHNNLNLNN